MVSAAGEVGYFDPVWRLRHVESEGIAAEFLHPFGPIGFVPFVDVQNSVRSHELRLAGSHAHNRFLEDFCSEAPGRLLGVPLIYFANDGAAILPEVGQLPADVFGIDWRQPLSRALAGLSRVDARPKAVQGNLDPCALYGTHQSIEKATKAMLSSFGGRHIATLGHGVYPDTPLDGVRTFVETVKNFRY